MRGRLTARPSAKSRKATRIASIQSAIGNSRWTSSSVMMMVTLFPSGPSRRPQAAVRELVSRRDRAQSSGFCAEAAKSMSVPQQIRLGMFLRPAGHHIAGWRHPDAWAEGGLSFPKYVETARTAERGLFDLLFSADALTGERYDPETLSRTSYVAWIEPMSLLTALAAVTQNFGLVCTATTTYDEPYHVARRFASLDLISGGRSGWNLVTSANDPESKNFGRES